MNIPDMETMTTNALITGDFAIVDYADARLKTFFTSLMQRLNEGSYEAFACTRGNTQLYLWTRSLKKNGIQKTSFIRKNGFLIALSDVQIETKEELFREIEYGTEITVLEREI